MTGAPPQSIVVAFAAFQCVVVLSAFERVVAGFRKHPITAAATGNRVVSSAADHEVGHQGRRPAQEDPFVQIAQPQRGDTNAHGEDGVAHPGAGGDRQREG